MDKIRIKKVDVFNILNLVLIGLILCFFIYRICFYLFLGQPLEMGNIPETAPNIFWIVKMFLFYSLGITPLILMVYFLIVVNRYKEKRMSKVNYLCTIIIALSYSLFWFCDFGSIWLYW